MSATTGIAAQSDKLLGQLKPQGYVSDYARVFDPAGRDALESLLRELDQKTGAQVAVVTLSSLQGGEIHDFANRLFEKWSIGQKGKDDGVLILTAIEDRKVWIEVGYGIEPIIPDARAGRILDQLVIPEFRRSQYAPGLNAAAKAVATIIAENAGVPLTGAAAVRSGQGRRDRGGLGLIGLLVLLLMIPLLLKNPWLAIFLLQGTSMRGGGRFGGGGFGRGDFGGGGFGGFGGGMSGGGGAGRSW